MYLWHQSILNCVNHINELYTLSIIIDCIYIDFTRYYTIYRHPKDGDCSAVDFTIGRQKTKGRRSFFSQILMKEKEEMMTMQRVEVGLAAILATRVAFSECDHV